jgi:hypothetical protein
MVIIAGEGPVVSAGVKSASGNILPSVHMFIPSPAFPALALRADLAAHHANARHPQVVWTARHTHPSRGAVRHRRGIVPDVYHFLYALRATLQRYTERCRKNHDPRFARRNSRYTCFHCDLLQVYPARQIRNCSRRSTSCPQIEVGC